MEDDNNSKEQGESLEYSDSGQGPENTEQANTETTSSATQKRSFNERIHSIISRLNIYLLLFIFIVVLSIGVILIGIQRNKKVDKPTTVNTQTLTADELKKMSDSEQKVGDPKSTLSIESNTIFSGKVLVKDSLDVAGTIKVGGALALPGLSVSGESTFDRIRANQITATGDSTMQGQLAVQKGLTVSGGGSFGGPVSVPTLSVQNLQLNGDLVINRHISTGGGTPSKSNGSSLGTGGTASISGSDTAGTATINTGSGAGAGCFLTIAFSQRFASNPHVVITPVGSAAASLQYYINRSSSEFSICTVNPPGAGQSFSFDYIVIS